MTPPRAGRVAWALSALAVGWPARADAQVHWDVGLGVGATERVVGGGPVPLPGPSAEIHGHVALLPMLRLGPYAAFDLSPASGAPTRQVYAAGLRAKVAIPVLAAPWRVWAFAGAGFADAYTRRSPGADAVGMLELPLGVGVGHKLRGPWELYAELGVRFVPARGTIQTAPPSGSAAGTPLVRDDLFAVGLSVGVSLAP